MCALENEHDLTTIYKQANIVTQSSSKRRGSRTVRKLKLKRLACVRPNNVKLSKGLTVSLVTLSSLLTLYDTAHDLEKALLLVGLHGI